MTRQRPLKYRPTPLNIACTIGIGIALYFVLDAGREGWGILVTISFIPFILAGLLADFLLQKYLLKFRQTLIIEISILTILFILYCWTKRTKTFIVPDKLESNFIATIYGVKDAMQLPKGWNYELTVPSNGIILTSSSLDSDLSVTEMRTNSGVTLNDNKTKLGWTRVMCDNFDCNGTVYEYQFWLVDSACCIYSNQDIEIIKSSIQRQFCGQ